MAMQSVLSRRAGLTRRLFTEGRRAAALALVAGLAAAALPLVASAQAAVNVDLAEFTLKASPASVANGTVNFAAKNNGTFPHELVIVRSSAAPASLPLNAASNAVDETKIEIVSRMPRVAAGASGSLSASLTPGSYVLLCNVTTHYPRGMSMAFTVTGAGGVAQAAPPKSGSGGYLDGGSGMQLWALGALAVVAAGVAGAGLLARRREQ